jgi:hypothetical protein
LSDSTQFLRFLDAGWAEEVGLAVEFALLAEELGLLAEEIGLLEDLALARIIVLAMLNNVKEKQCSHVPLILN